MNNQINIRFNQLVMRDIEKKHKKQLEINKKWFELKEKELSVLKQILFKYEQIDFHYKKENYERLEQDKREIELYEYIFYCDPEREELRFEQDDNLCIGSNY